MPTDHRLANLPALARVVLDAEPRAQGTVNTAVIDGALCLVSERAPDVDALYQSAAPLLARGYVAALARIAALEAGINDVIDGRHPNVEDGDVLGALDLAFGIVKQAAGANGNLVEDLCKAAGVDWEGDDPVRDVRARIADLEAKLAAAITHPLAVAALETHAALRGDLKNSAPLDAAIKADHAWTDAGRPLRITTP